MRWSTWIAAAGAVVISGTVATAQYRQDYYYPGYNTRPYARPTVPDVAAAPRPDFPGAKQSETSTRRSHKHGRSANK